MEVLGGLAHGRTGWHQGGRGLVEKSTAKPPWAKHFVLRKPSSEATRTNDVTGRALALGPGKPDYEPALLTVNLDMVSNHSMLTSSATKRGYSVSLLQ